MRVCFTLSNSDVPFARFFLYIYIYHRAGNCNRARGQSISRNNSIKNPCRRFWNRWNALVSSFIAPSNPTNAPKRRKIRFYNARRALPAYNVTGGSLLACLTPTGQCRSGLMLHGFTRNPVARKPEGGIWRGTRQPRVNLSSFYFFAVACLWN